MALVELPRCIEAGVKDRAEESPVIVRTDHILVRYEYGGTCCDGPFSGLALIYTADKTGHILSVADRPYKPVKTILHPKSDGATFEDIRAAVKFLGFELAED